MTIPKLFQSILRSDEKPAATAKFHIQGMNCAFCVARVEKAISQDGGISANLTATYDLLLTQQLILQPRLDFDAAVQSAEKFGVGEGVNSLGLGLRLRYEFTREFAPYIGVQWRQEFGETADLSRRGGGRDQDIALVLGVRLWF